MKKVKHTALSPLAEQAASITISKKINGKAIAEAFKKAPFVKKKMEKGAKILSVAGLPR